MNLDSISDEFIQKVANSVRSLIKTESFYKGISEKLEDSGLFDQNIDNLIINSLFSTGTATNQIIDDYLSIINRQNSSEIYKLHFDIFSHQMSSSSSNSSLNIGDEDENDQEFEEENNNDVYIPSNTNNLQLAPTVSLAQLGEYQEKIISQIAKKLNIHPEIAEILLQIHHFDQDALRKEFYTNFSKCIEMIGLTDHDLSQPIHFKRHKDKSTNECCPICFDEEENGETFYSLPCKHYFCKSCISEHIKNIVSECKYEIICPYEGCNCHIVQKDVQKFCDTETATKYFNTIIESQITLSENLHHCAREGCPNILTSESVGLGFVATCQSCNCQMCWKCKSKSHAPLDCSFVVKWGEISKEENAELKWIKENTKACPKCHERIERNGGCTYIKCPKCSYEFCYVCGGPFPAHKNHNPWCSTYKDYDNLQIPTNVDVERLSFYLTRFLANRVSHENEIKQRDMRQTELLNNFVYYYEYPSERLQMNDAIKLTNEIFNAIDEARSVLIWSYPHAFFMNPASQELKMFEYVQKELNIILEEMVYLVENKQLESPLVFRRTMMNVKSYTKSLMKHVYEKQ